ELGRTVRPVDLPMVTMTWVKFRATVLPTAEAIDLYVPSRRGSFIALTTAADGDAPPILKWDRPGERNPVAWYVYPGGSPATSWGLTGEAWTPLTALVPLPTLWGSQPMAHLAE